MRGIRTTPRPCVRSSIAPASARQTAVRYRAVPSSTSCRRSSNCAHTHSTPRSATMPAARCRCAPIRAHSAIVMFGGSPAYATVRETDAAARAFSAGDRAPLLRLMAESQMSVDSRDASRSPARTRAGLAAAVFCQDPPQVFDLALDPAQRPAALEREFIRLQHSLPDLYAPFTLDEYRGMPPDYVFIDECLQWPSPAAGGPAPPLVVPRAPYRGRAGARDLGRARQHDQCRGRRGCGQSLSARPPCGDRQQLSRQCVATRARSDCGAQLVRDFIAHLAIANEECAAQVPPVPLAGALRAQLTGAGPGAGAAGQPGRRADAAGGHGGGADRRRCAGAGAGRMVRENIVRVARRLIQRRDPRDRLSADLARGTVERGCYGVGAALIRAARGRRCAQPSSLQGCNRRGMARCRCAGRRMTRGHRDRCAAASMAGSFGRRRRFIRGGEGYAEAVLGCGSYAWRLSELMSGSVVTAQSVDTPEPGSAAEIAKATTEPRFLSPWVASLPASASVASPRAFLKRIPGAAGALADTRTAYAYSRALARPLRASNYSPSAAPRKGGTSCCWRSPTRTVSPNLDRLKAANAALADPRPSMPAAARAPDRGRRGHYITSTQHCIRTKPDRQRPYSNWPIASPCPKSR